MFLTCITALELQHSSETDIDYTKCSFFAPVISCRLFAYFLDKPLNENLLPGIT